MVRGIYHVFRVFERRVRVVGLTVSRQVLVQVFLDRDEVLGQSDLLANHVVQREDVGAVRRECWKRAKSETH